MNTIVCIGDSLVYGKGWLNGSDLQKPLNVRLAEKFTGLKVINLGVNGDTTTEMEARKATVDAYKPFRVIVMGGINDITSSVAVATIESKLQAMYTYFKVTKGYEVWAITITPRDSDTAQQVADKSTVNNWIKNTATSVDRVIDAFTAIADPQDTSNRLSAYADSETPNHFNDTGLEAIVATI